MYLVECVEAPADVRRVLKTLRTENPDNVWLGTLHDEQVSWIDWWGSSFSDPGPDFNRFILHLTDGTKHAITQNGY